MITRSVLLVPMLITLERHVVGQDEVQMEGEALVLALEMYGEDLLEGFWSRVFGQP
jgi:hypothetical protein